MSEESLTVNDLEIAGGAENYRDWIVRRARPYLGQRILDAGAGIGTFTELLLDGQAELVVAADGYPPFIDVLRQRLGSRLQQDPILVDLAGPGMAELSRYRFDTVVCINVLEHIEDDRAALANFFSVLQPGGRVVIFVPAHMALYGSVDRQLEHCRRYSRSELRRKLTEAGFTIEVLSEMNLIGIAGWWLNNRGQQRVSPKQIALYDKLIVPLAERMERMVPMPMGLSIVAVGRKGLDPTSG